ncbi:retrotransposon protein, putative, ty1-copia subclass, partial [Tanacetum coccineum]
EDVKKEILKCEYVVRGEIVSLPQVTINGQVQRLPISMGTTAPECTRSTMDVRGDPEQLHKTFLRSFADPCLFTLKYTQLRLVLSTEDKEKYLEQPIPTAPVAAAPDQPIPPAALATYNEWVKNQKEIDVMITIICTTWKNKNKKQSKAAKGVHGKGKGKMAYASVAPSYAPKPKNPPPPKKDNPAKDAICHHCGEVGIFTIELYSFPSTSWVYDTGCGTHICNTTQGLWGSKKLNPGALSIYMGNSQRATVEAIGNYHLCLPSGLVIVLNNCHYAPFITRGIISVSRLYDDGFTNRFELNNAISVSKNNVVYFSAIPRDDVYEIEMSCSNTNDSSMYTVSNKRAKLNLDSSLLWHCRLGHISKKRIEKLQHDRLLNSTDTESLGKCVSSMFGKMARKPYSHQVEKAKDLLGLIHTDVCDPFRIMSRQGANYFVTFTDDFSRQKFLDHLKEHRIITHRTPPYTPQHNGVSERRNQTLLDMVRSMMSQTTIPKSFWDYALESAARILNMVPTKKGCEALVKRGTLTRPKKLEPRSFKCIFVGYPKETMRYSFYNPSKNKVFVARIAEFFKSNLIDQEASGSLEDLEIIQEEDTNPSLDTSLNHEEDDQEIDEPQSDINPICRSSRTKRAPNRMCLYINAEEH